MKVLLGLVLLCGLLFGILYYTGMFAFDPGQQAAEARKAVKPGMSWVKVVDAIGEPREYQVFVEKTMMIGGEPVVTVKAGPSAPFSRENIAERLQEGTLPHGFILAYTFSASDAFSVIFDGNGDVESIQEMATMRDLLDR